MSRPNLSHIYNPANQSPEELVENFVIRTREFKRINNSIISTSLKASPQHFLIEGQRGTGKTSLLLRLQYSISDKNAPNYLLPIQLPEEQYSIFDLCRLWENVAEYLDEIPGFECTSELLDSHREDNDYPSICYELIDALLIKNKKRLVLMLDNFGEMLKRIGETDQKRLRDILHMSRNVQIIATSAKTLEQTYKYKSVFFEFFKIIRLGGLNQADSIILLEKLATMYGSERIIRKIIKEEPHRIETIRRLSGGIPRTLILLFEILLDDTAQVFNDLESILDKVTPLYKHRMDDLSRQQQIIMDAIALNWDGISNREIAGALKNRSIDGKKIAAQLKELEKNGLVLSKPLDKKNKIYFIAERFFNIWYLMRFGRKKNKDHVKWLVLFLQEWCSPDELKTRAQAHIIHAENKTLDPRGGYIMAEAMAQALPDTELRHRLLESSRNNLENGDPLQGQVSSEPVQASEYENDVLDKKQNLLGEIAELKQAVEQGDAKAMFNLARLYQTEFKDYDNAVRYYKMAIDKDDPSAMFNLALLYQIKFKDFDSAIRYYKMAISKDDADAMNSLALLYEVVLNEFDNAIRYYKMAIEKNHVAAMVNLAWLYQTEFKDFDSAIQYYKLAMDNDDAEAMYKLAWLYDNEFKEFANATQYYKMAIEKKHVGALNDLSWNYYQAAIKKDEALKWSQLAIKLDSSDNVLHTYATIALWHQKFEASNKAINTYIANQNYSSYIIDVTDYFILLLAMDQRHTAFNLFNEYPKLKDEIKPVYFATMKLLQDEYPKEYLKMGSELEETVDEVLEKAGDYRKKYATD